jgi:hypothetical protein
VHEGAHLVVDDALDVAGAGLRLALAGGVDVQLQRRAAAGEHVALEIGRDVEHEGVRPASMPRSMSARPTCAGGMNCGGCSAATMRPESCERSSSTTAIEAR